MIVSRVIVASFVSLFFVMAPVAVQSVADLPSGFAMETVTTGLTLPVAMDFAPDGRIFVAEKSGVVRVITADGRLLPEPFITLPHVNDMGDRGLIGMVLDPQFASNGYVYLAHTYENNPADYTGEKTARVVRVTARGNQATPGSLTVILGTVTGTPTSPSCKDYPTGSDCIASDSHSHTVGGIRFGTDGKLYIATGDGAGFIGLDEHAFRAQDIDHLSGKILRINADGTAPSDNPFYNGDSQANRSKVWAYGLRNPYRFTVHPTTGAVIGGEVGWFTKEEVNHLEAGKNYGWPCREGSAPSVGGYADFPQCAHIGATQNPIYEYVHQGGSGAITGGAFALSEMYPATFRGAYVFADFTLDFMKYLLLDGTMQVASVHNFATDTAGPVEFVTGPNGLLYYLSIYAGEVRRLVYTQTTQSPVAIIGTQATAGQAPFSAQLTAADSYDPGNENLSYAWDFGDGQISSGTTVTHVFSTPGVYTVTLRVTTPRGASGTATTQITVTEPHTSGNVAPYFIAASSTPLDKYIGSHIDFSVTIGNAEGTDPFVVYFAVFDDNDNFVDDYYYESQQITPGQTQSYDFTWLPPALGDYTLAVGLFSNDWTTLYEWSHATTLFTVRDRMPGGDTPPAVDYVSTNIASQTVAPQQPVAITSTFYNAGGAGSVVIDIEVYNEAGEQVHQTFFDPQFFAAHEQQDISTQWIPQREGQYIVSVGVFTQGWDALDEWHHAVGTVHVQKDSGNLQEVHIFDDTLLAPWQNWSWGTDGLHVITTDAPGRSGTTQALRIAYRESWAGLYVNHVTPFTVNDAQKITFWIRPGFDNAQNLVYAKITNAQYQDIGEVDIASYSTNGDVTNDTWTQIVIPLSAFIQGTQSITGIILQDVSGGKSVYTIDEMRIK